MHNYTVADYDLMIIFSAFLLPNVCHVVLLIGYVCK